MTSPHTPKPSAGPEGYESVHSRGSTYGQGLDYNSVRGLLMGRERSMFSGLGGLFSGVLTFVFGGFASLLGGLLMRSSPPPNEIPEILSPIKADLEGALEPFLQKVDKALDDADKALDDASKVREDMEDEFDPEMENSSMWELQFELNRLDDEIEKAQNIAIAANSDAIGEMTQYVQRMFFCPSGSGVTGDHWRTWIDGGRRHFEALPGWNGHAIVMTSFTRSESTGSTRAADDRHSHSFDDVQPYSFTYSIPTSVGGRAFSVNSTDTAVVHYSISPGEAVTEPLTAPNTTVPNSNNWNTILEWEVPEDTSLSASATFYWANKTKIANYWQRISLDGQNITASSSSKSAPWVGHQPRKATVSVAPQKVRKGQILRLEAAATHSNSLNRQLSDIKLNVTWIKPEDS